MFGFENHPATFYRMVAASYILIVSVILIFFTFFRAVHSRAYELSIASMVVSIALYSQNNWIYAISLFIIGTGFTSTKYLENLAAIVFRNKGYFDSTKGSIPNPLPDPPLPTIQGILPPVIRPPFSAMEYKILNTLWTKQINKFPDFGQLFTFRIGSTDPGYGEYQVAREKLLQNGLIRQVDIEGLGTQCCLTNRGMKYCHDNYHTFPSDQWWPEEIMNETNLQKVKESKRFGEN